ncbi:MAG: hypothetical protein ACOH15_11280 [Acetobacterium sp.]
MKKRKRIWVVDLGEAVTKITLGKADENGVILIENYWIEKTPKNMFKEGSPEKKLDLVVFLRDLLRDYYHRDELMLVFNHRKMILASFDFPMMAVEEVWEALYWKMQIIIPERFADWRLDFLAQKRIDVFECLGINDKKLDVLGIGVPKEVLAAYCEVFKGTKHGLKIIEPQFQGLGRLLKKKGEESTLIIDLGYTSTRLLFYTQGFLQEERRIETKAESDLNILLAPIIEAVQESHQSPLSIARGFENETIYLLGGGSLRPGVLEVLKEKIKRKIEMITIMARDSGAFMFLKEISEEQLCLLMPCLGGMLNWPNNKNDGKVNNEE